MTEQQPSFPCLPVVCLETAKDLTTHEILCGCVEKDEVSAASSSTSLMSYYTVIDFWTTRCVRCPAALDALNEMAGTYTSNNHNSNTTEQAETEAAIVKFISICCDQCDGAREIIEAAPKSASDPPRWANIHHYFMDQEYKEQAKAILGFTSVPFYVVIKTESNGGMEIVYKGNQKATMQDCLTASVASTTPTTSETVDASTTMDKENAVVYGDSNKNNIKRIDCSIEAVDKSKSSSSRPVEAREFVLEDLDF